jgi:hypothetical protein
VDSGSFFSVSSGALSFDLIVGVRQLADVFSTGRTDLGKQLTAKRLSRWTFHPLPLLLPGQEDCVFVQ